MTTFKQQNSFPLRMPEDLRKRLEERAKANGRSVNAEIVAMLQQALDNQGAGLGAIPAGMLLNEVIERYGSMLQIVIAKDAADQAGIKGHG